MNNEVQLPKGWSICKLSNLLCETETASPTSSGLDKFLYVDIDAVDNRNHRIAMPKSLPVSQAPSRARRVIKADDVIISLVRPYLKNIAIIPPELDGQWASTAFTVCRPRAGIDTRFLFYRLISDTFIKSIPTYGDSPPAGHPEDLLALQIKLPPSIEQKRIADRIDELFTDLDAGVTALVRVQKKLKRYRAALLHAAVTGRLTADWRAKNDDNGESGQKLLQRILKARKDRWLQGVIERYVESGKTLPADYHERYPSPIPTTEIEDVSFPKSWAIANVSQLVTTVTSGSRDWKQYYDRGTGTFIMAGNVRMGALDLTKRQAVAPPQDDRDRVRSQVEVGDLLVTIVGANTGDVCLVDRKLDEHYVCQSVALMRPVDSVLSNWLLTWFTAPSGAQSQFRTAIYGAGRPHLSFDQLEQTWIPLPPIDEQMEVARAISERVSNLDNMQVEVEHALCRAVRLRQSILKSAFEGKLVHQDPDDEPASVLLKRIQAEIASDASIAITSTRTKRASKKSSKIKPTPLLDALDASPKKRTSKSKKKVVKKST